MKMEPMLTEWKQEPVSPLTYDEVYRLAEENFYQTSDEDDVKFETEFAGCETKAEVASYMLENLESLADLDDIIKQEPFLLDEKMLPMLDEVEPPRAMLVPNNQLKMEYIKPDTQSLLKEFETVYVELNSSGALTPPQSPPMDQQQQQQQPMLTTLEPLLQPIKYHHLNHHQQQQQHHHVADQQPQTPYSVPDKQLLYRNIPIDYPPVATPQPDIAHELAVVEELVRTRVEDMQWTSSSGPSSPNSSSSSSGSSNFGDCSSDDPEWIPEPIESYADAVPGLKPKKRSKPYARTNPDDKKSRKKEQNKNAATRYRLKKKAEVEEILLEEKQLLDHSAELGTKITDLQREIKYLKGLMRDLFKAKGLIN